jgi:hypothetical protein
MLDDAQSIVPLRGDSQPGKPPVLLVTLARLGRRDLLQPHLEGSLVFIAAQLAGLPKAYTSPSVLDG